jgi:thiol-disulfide isomerase/thioredoxin
MPLPLLTTIETKEKFAEHLQSNPGLLILKFGATWCGPCKRIDPLVNACIQKMPDNVQCALIDIDECFDLYGFLQKKKMINGVPGILCYHKNNLNYIPNDSVVGADVAQVSAFFERCFKKATELLSA